MSNKIVLFFIIALMALLVGCQQQALQEGVKGVKIDKEGGRTFSLNDIQSHSSPDDCWLLIDGKVYDVTDFVSSHPGGKALLEGCGKDATELFETRPMGSGTPHSSGARDMLAGYYIGFIV